MKTFDQAFFNELAAFDDLAFAKVPPRDGFRPCVSELHAAGKISDAFLGLTRDFVHTLAVRSRGRYVFEQDFHLRPFQVFSYSQDRSGRKQLHIGFDAHPRSDVCSGGWGVSIGLGFDFRNSQGIVAECVNDYETFYAKVFAEPELFDATFGSLGGYAEPTDDFTEPVKAGMALQAIPDILQNWLLFGRRLTPDSITAVVSLDGFADECIRVFDAITYAGY